LTLRIVAKGRAEELISNIICAFDMMFL